jgi:steroid delta-isomerase-like uncharacterized protein
MASTELIRKAVDAINRHEPEAFAASYAEDAVVYDPYYAEPLRGRAAIQKDMEDFFRAFPDTHNAVSVVMAEGNVLATEIAMTGTHTGLLALPSGDVPPTGKKLSFGGGIFSRVNSQGLIVEEHRYYDVLGQLVQLGLMPEAEAVS